jgi:hypothetical protein
MKEALRGRRFSSDEEIIGTVQNWLETRPKTFFSDRIKKNLRNTGTGALKLRGITLKVTLVSFLYIYNECAFFKVPSLFDLPS